MRIELRVDRNGQTIFRAESDTGWGSSFAEFSKLALREFNQQHTEVSLLDDDVWLKFGTVRCPGPKDCPSPSSTNFSAKRVALAPTNEEQGDASRAAH